MGLNVASNIGRHQGGPFFFGLKAAHLLVDRANEFSLSVVEHRPVHGSRPMVQGEFPLTAHIDDGIKGQELSGFFALASFGMTGRVLGCVALWCAKFWGRMGRRI